MNFFKSPKFWNDKDSRIVKCLSPLSKIYSAISSFKINSVTPEKASVPVICVGNVVMGGAGKTPTVELICSILSENSHNPHILSGGYGGYLKNVVRVDPSIHYYLQVGDEALLSAMVAPTWIGKNKIKSGKAAVLSGADILVLDDGFQNNAIEKDIKVLVIDSKQQFGNGHIFPAGPLRESVESGVRKSDIILIIGDENKELEDRLSSIRNGIPISYAGIDIVDEKNHDGGRVIGFCGLGYPDKFHKTLKSCGYDIIDFIAFSDHHPYTITEIQKLIKAAKASDAKLVTTMKDFVKIPEVFKHEVSVINIKLTEKDCILRDFLLKKLPS